MFRAGVGAYLQRARGATREELSRFLLTRGLWLVVLEFTVIRLGTWFNLDYSFLGLMQVDAGRRRRLLAWMGTALVVAFVGLRALNGYGDPQPWREQQTWVFTLLSFLNVTKYPVSLLFLLMTLGPALLVLAWLEPRRMDNGVARALVTFRRVPLFFYILQWPLAHGLMIGVSLLAGKDVGYLFVSPPAFFTTAPADAGFPLWAVDLCWAAVIAALVPLCRWFAEIKRQHPRSLLRYL